MPSFKRSFETVALKRWCAEHPGSAVHALLKQWALPGSATTGEACLRVAVRSGYLNFYVKGQSAAKLTCRAGGPSISVHSKYVEGHERGSEIAAGNATQSYIEFGSADLRKPETALLVPGWIKTAETYASAEKRFVDDLVAANAGVLDLEMGLPASDELGSERVAPRMDLVLIEPASGSEPAIAFWEAKCANNGELRAKGNADPKVIGQIARYVDWMRSETRATEVRDAYRQAASVLTELLELAGHSADAECSRLWTMLANSKAPKLSLQPGIVIGNYWPRGSTEGIASERMRQCAKSFEKNGHREKLEKAGLQLHQVGPDEMVLALPRLGGLGA
ncbi:hypothetical protein GGQ97_001556 [Sphingomonas kaistensis]|uniref:Uncharacterized protein n=1 Tax=Sphingomonas kaistensis TaxID=298708 RepID=A0A7X5Y6Q7_9SPHN|nr:hypothetical protein [Sphingomonas kaistensis]NJC05763.1 hypothetical protein [Sphingomonas kaistensis]